MENHQTRLKASLSSLKEYSEYDALFILPNNDAGYREIIDHVKNSGYKYVKTLPIKDYVNLLKRSIALVGNSSSGIHGTSVLTAPTINMGSRQNARLRSNNVFDAGYSKEEIVQRIAEAIKWRGEKANKVYGEGNSAKKIVDILERADISKKIIQKQITY